MAAIPFGRDNGGGAKISGSSDFGGLSGASNGNRCCDGGRNCEVPSNAGDRLTGAAPQPRPDNIFPRLLCSECGSENIQATAWVMVNSGEVVNDDGPTDQIWCPACEEESPTVEDCGFGFELWRSAEWSGWFATFAEALAEAKESERPYEIAGSATPVEVTR